MKSAAWFRRRSLWVEEELELIAPARQVTCLGCGSAWALSRDDLHHVSYARLGDEAHEDLWPMCRVCHSRLHEIMRSSKSWRKMPASRANHFALALLQEAGGLAGGSEQPSGRASTLWEFL